MTSWVMCPSCERLLVNPRAPPAHLAHPFNLNVIGAVDAAGRAMCPVCKALWRRTRYGLHLMLGAGNRAAPYKGRWIRSRSFYDINAGMYAAEFSVHASEAGRTPIHTARLGELFHEATEARQAAQVKACQWIDHREK